MKVAALMMVLLVVLAAGVLRVCASTTASTRTRPVLLVSGASLRWSPDTSGPRVRVVTVTPRAGRPHPRVHLRWGRLAACESSSEWHINTGNGYYGAFQFLASTWLSFGGARFAARADLASPGEQVVVARRVLAVEGWGAWPACSRKLGWR